MSEEKQNTDDMSIFELIDNLVEACDNVIEEKKEEAISDE
tara:strand:- start:38 stop:157 length:120 start_codon:yes stop_codon:yes gene_type:complete